MTKHENIAKALKARLSELTTRVGEIDSKQIDIRTFAYHVG